MIRHAVSRTVLGGLVIATIIATLNSCSSATTGTGLPGERHAQLIQGNWVYTSAVVTSPANPDFSLELTDFYEITETYGPTSSHTVYFPALFDVVRQGWSNYVLDQSRGTIKAVATGVDLEPEYEYLRGQYIGAEAIARYTFESRDVLVIRSKQLIREGGVLVQVDIVSRLKRT